MARRPTEVNMSNKPLRNGKKWEEEEITLLLQSITNKKTIKEIANEHQRTPGGITSELKKIAYRFWIVDKKPIEEIATLTGLSKEDIELTIARRQNYDNTLITRRDQALERKKVLKDIQKMREAIVSIHDQLDVLIAKLG